MEKEVTVSGTIIDNNGVGDCIWNITAPANTRINFKIHNSTLADLYCGDSMAIAGNRSSGCLDKSLEGGYIRFRKRTVHWARFTKAG